MGTIEAINMLLTLAQAAANTATAMQQVGAIVQKAQAEGRTELTADEIAVIKQQDDTARMQLVQELSKRLIAQ